MTVHHRLDFARRAAVLALMAASLLCAAAPDDTPNLAGTWTWTWKDAEGETHRHTLEVEKAGEKLAARELFDDEPAVRVDDLKLDGKTVKFSVARGERTATYSGKVTDDATINGTVEVTTNGQAVEFVWKAEKRKAEPKPKAG